MDPNRTTRRPRIRRSNSSVRIFAKRRKQNEEVKWGEPAGGNRYLSHSRYAALRRDSTSRKFKHPWERRAGPDLLQGFALKPLSPSCFARPFPGLAPQFTLYFLLQGPRLSALPSRSARALPALAPQFTLRRVSNHEWPRSGACLNGKSQGSDAIHPYTYLGFGGEAASRRPRRTSR